MEVMVGPSLSIEYVLERPPEDEALVRCPLRPGEEEAGGSRKGIGFRASGKSLEEESSESSSSIGGPEDSDEEEEEEDVGVSSGGMASLISLDDALPVKRGLSNHYSGKSKSFANLSEVNSVKQLKKEEKPLNKRRRVLMANKWYMKKANSFYSWENPKSMPLLTLNEEEDDDRLVLPSPSSSSSSESWKPRMKSQSCFSLSDLQEEDQLLLD